MTRQEIRADIRYNIRKGNLPFTFTDNEKPYFNYYKTVGMAAKRFNVKCSTQNKKGVWTITKI